jgi:hypothetical protein
MSQMLGIIEDGYTERGVLAASGLHPRVEFTYRPMLVEQIGDHFQAAEKLAGKNLRRLVADHIARHVKGWDLKDAKGDPVPLDKDHVLLLRPRLFNRLFSVVVGDEAPDERPGADAAEVDAEVADLLKAAETGRSAVALREERHRGNS